MDRTAAIMAHRMGAAPMDHHHMVRTAHRHPVVPAVVTYPAVYFVSHNYLFINYFKLYHLFSQQDSHHH